MKPAERALLPAWLPALQLSTVAWAGARASTRGMQLYRDGALGRLVIGEREVVAQVLDGELPERPVLHLEHTEIWADCSCGQAPCAHAVAAVHELCKRLRQFRDAADQRDGVMAALRQRVSGKATEAPKMLTNLERLPIDAGVDMVALALRQSLRHGPQEMRELTLLTARLTTEAVSSPERAGELAMRLLLALSARKVVFVPLPSEAEQAVVALVPLVVGIAGSATLGEARATELVGLTMRGPPQVAVHAAAALESAALRDASTCLLLQQLVRDDCAKGETLWRELAAPTPRDRLASGIAAASLEHIQVDDALELALVWPPMRHTLQTLGRALGERGRADDVLRLAGHFDPRGEPWLALVQAAADAALGAGATATAARLVGVAMERHPQPAWYDLLRRVVPASEWPQRRTALVARLVADDDPPWLVDRLASEPDARDALFHAVVTAPLRDRLVREALSLLREMDPLAAFQARCARLAALVHVPGQASRVLADELMQLRKLAREAGEPELASELTRLYARERADDRALAGALAKA